MNLYMDGPGNYVATPTKIELIEAKSGNIGIRITFAIVGGEYDGELTSRDFWITPNALGITKRALRACGADLDGLANEDEIIDRIVHGTLQGFGKNVRLIVGEEADLDGEPVYRVKYVNPLTEPSKSSVGGGDLRRRAMEVLKLARERAPHRAPVRSPHAKQAMSPPPIESESPEPTPASPVGSESPQAAPQATPAAADDATDASPRPEAIADAADAPSAISAGPMDPPEPGDAVPRFRG